MRQSTTFLHLANSLEKLGRLSSKGNGKFCNTWTADNYLCMMMFWTETGGTVGIKCSPNGLMLSESDGVLSSLWCLFLLLNLARNMVLLPGPPDHLELPSKPFHHSSCSDSSCVSESGSDIIIIKREVMQKLRQH